MTRISLSDALTRLAAIETRTSEIYARAAEETSLPGAGELFSELSRLEGEQVQRIDEMRKAVGENASATVDFDESLEKQLSDPWPVITVHNIHVFAIRAERAAVRLYQGLLDQIKDGPVAPLLGALLAEEKEHRARVDSWFDGIDANLPHRQT